MMETQANGPAVPSGWLPRFTAFLFDGVVYLTFLITVLYAIGFVSGLVVPKAIDSGTESPAFEAVLVNLALMSLCAVQHSGVALNSLKHRWEPLIPIPMSIARSTHVLCASLALLLMFWQWRPMPAGIWHIEDPETAMLIATLSFVAWVIVFTSAFLIDQSASPSLRRAANSHTVRAMPAACLQVTLRCRLLRQPIYPAVIVAVWATPTMSVGHLLLAAAATAYVFTCVMLKDFIRALTLCRGWESASVSFAWRKSNWPTLARLEMKKP